MFVQICVRNGEREAKIYSGSPGFTRELGQLVRFRGMIVSAIQAGAIYVTVYPNR